MDESRGINSVSNDIHMGLQRIEPEPVTRPVGPKVERTHEVTPKTLPMSAPVMRFNKTLLRELGQTSATKQLLGRSLSPRKTLQDALRGRYGRNCVKRVAKDKGRDIYDTIDAHQGPVIVLGVNGGPEFVFERLEDGTWQGYEANSEKPLPPGVGPKDKVAEQNNRHHGLMYSLFTVKGWEGESRLTSGAEALILEPHKKGTAEDWPVPMPEPGRRRSGADDDEDGLGMTSVHHTSLGDRHRLRKFPRFEAGLVDGGTTPHAHASHAHDTDNDSIDLPLMGTSRSTSSLSDHVHDEDEHGWDPTMDQVTEQVEEQQSLTDHSVPISPIDQQS